MTKLSCVIITKNEEKNLRRCLESVPFADEIIVVDSQSVDNTLEIAREFNAKIYSPVWKGYGPAKQEGVRHASHDWILSIDADEVVSEPLRQTIEALLSGGFAADGYYIPRKTNFIGRWINHSGWYPDYVLRLFNKQKGRFDEAVVHEKVIVEGKTGYLKEDLLHYSYPTLEEYFRKFNNYTTIGAEELHQRGVKSGLVKLLFKPPVQFFKSYCVKLGILDGIEGFLISFLSSVAVLVKYAKLHALNKRKITNE